ncbi:MAG: ribonuclease D [Atopobiaceae bacterium]|nr:ribonuclease D [Atopobiaceae bacterium]MCI1318271.1 ribonuclease D [Atopobiaceae bacterium]MCI1388563.1 ribonuclease D [Atopobiaceae bacterium]MCI1432062.1 ribonuclease D [Atopobiaceae bacterium]MCI1470520.1 ribonuclease D [Atopobiaceae bacterium]
MFLSNSADLAAFCERAASCDIVAVDTEFIRERTYWPRLCLVQLRSGDEIALVDPIAIDDLGPLGELMGNEGVTKVFHSCSQDLEVLEHELGVIPRPIFDTQIAAAFLGHRMQIGYGPLVESVCGVSLGKAESLTDWSKRPLDARQLSYAEDDVRYLPAVYRSLMQGLEERGRVSWALPEMDACCDPANFGHDPRAAYLKLKHVASLTRRQLAICREVAAWREAKAAERDLVRKFVMRDEVVVEVAKRAPKSVEALRRIRGTEQLGEGDAREVVEAVRVGVGSPADSVARPRRRSPLPADQGGVVDLMSALVRIVSEREGIASSIVATHDDLVSLLAGDPGCRLREGWRKGLVGDLLGELLAGRIGLTVKDGKVEML